MRFNLVKKDFNQKYPKNIAEIKMHRCKQKTYLALQLCHKDYYILGDLTVALVELTVYYPHKHGNDIQHGTEMYKTNGEFYNG